jgi:hypothetical protein
MRHPQGKTVLALAGSLLLTVLSGASAMAQAPGFSGAAPMHASRAFHSDTLLLDGRVLSAGGFDGSRLGPPILDAAELYDRNSDTWTRTGNLTAARAAHVAVRLQDGRVLVAGGLTNGPPPPAPPVVLASAELFDPATGMWTATGSMEFAREDASITLLTEGRVLVVGGSTGGPFGTPHASAELYDPASGTWTRAADMSIARVDHIAVRLDGGNVLVAGGRGPMGALASSEIYDPNADAWTPAADMTQVREDHIATLLDDGRVLVSGGDASMTERLASAEVYDPSTDSWDPVENDMTDPRVDHVSVRLGDGTVLVAGGIASPDAPTASADLYDSTTNRFTPAGRMTVVRGGPEATLLEDGTVLITGGLVRGGQAIATTDSYSPAPGGAALKVTKTRR